MKPHDVLRFPLVPAAVLLALALGIPSSCGQRAPAPGASGKAPESRAPVGDHDHEHGADEARDHDGHQHAGTAHDEHDSDDVVLSAAAIERYGVTVSTARRERLQSTLTAPARVGFDTEAMAHVGSPLRGRIAEVNVRVGDSVRRGQQLAILESPELGEAQAEFLQRRVAVRTAEPAVDLTRVAWQRASGLYERSQGISLTEVQRREAEHKAALAAVTAAESARTAAANRLRLLGMDAAAIDELERTGQVVPRYAIRAAIDGVVVQREVTLGELVSPDREYLMVLADDTKLWVLADVPETQLARVRAGASARVGVGIGAEHGAKRVDGTVTFLSPFVDPTTRTATVRIEVHGSDLGLRPGMFAQAEIDAADVGDAETSGRTPSAPVTVPEEAVHVVEGAPSVFVPVAGEPGAFRRRSVTIGTPVRGRVPVHAGLSEGEAFVAGGAFVLKAELTKDAAGHEH